MDKKSGRNQTNRAKGPSINGDQVTPARGNINDKQPLDDPSTPLLTKQNKNRGRRLPAWCQLVLIILAVFMLTFLLASAVVGGVIAAVFIKSTSSSPNTTSSLVTIYHAQSSPVVILVARFESAEYSSFAVNSYIPMDTSASEVFWVVKSIEPIMFKTTYNKTLDLQYARNFHLYALNGSSFRITFSSLEGPASENVTVEFRRFIGSGHTGKLLASQSVGPSVVHQLVDYTSVEAGFVEFRLINRGLSGNFTYNFIINELDTSSLAGQSQYSCTVNSTNSVCEHSSEFTTNNLLASVTLDQAYVQGYPTMNVTLTARDLEPQKLLPLLLLIVMVCAAVAFAMLCLIIILMALLVCTNGKKKNDSTKNY